ncbi:hypothetical protein ACPBEI_12770 (plasmid) [Latilactobacillus sakei]
MEYTKELLESGKLSILEATDGWYVTMARTNWPKWGRDSYWYRPENISLTSDLNQATYFSNEVYGSEIFSRFFDSYKSAKFKKIKVSFEKTIEVKQIIEYKPTNNKVGLLLQVSEGWYLTYQGLNWPKWCDVGDDFTTDEVGVTSNLSKAFRFDVTEIDNNYLYFIKSIARNFPGAKLMEVSVSLQDRE